MKVTVTRTKFPFNHINSKFDIEMTDSEFEEFSEASFPIKQLMITDPRDLQNYEESEEVFITAQF